MKLRFIFASMMLAAGCLGIHAQQQENKESNPNPWFIQGNLGMTYSTGGTGIGKLLSPGGQLAVGKYFSPVWGARLAISGWQGKAPGVRSGSDGFFYGAATVDGLMNVSQLIREYHERPIDVSVIAGIGFNRAFHGASSFMGRLGAQMSLRLNEAIDFNVEATANGVSDRWNKRDDHSIDTYFQLGVGVTYKFKTGFRCVTCLSEEPIEICYSEEELNDIVNEQRQEVRREVEEVIINKTDTVYVEKLVEAEGVSGIHSHVVFGLGRTDIQTSQEMNVDAIAEYLEANPKAKATIAGYADTGTGTKEINLRLAKQRAQVVYDRLVKKYGISPDRLTMTSMEGSEQPFKNNNDWNRVVIMTAE